MSRYVIVSFHSMRDADAFESTYVDLVTRHPCSDDGADYDVETGQRSFYAVAPSIEVAETFAAAVRDAAADANALVRVCIGEECTDSDSEYMPSLGSSDSLG